MATKVTVDGTGGTSLATLLTVLFVTLKLIGVIAWSWWWVLSPLWISFGLFLAITIIVLLFMAAAYIIGGKN